MIAYNDFLDGKQLNRVTDALRNGCIMIIPTDSFYCFVCDIENHKAASRLAQIKGKKLEKAVFSILCGSISQASEYTKPLTKEQFRLLKQNTPGAFTFIFQASNKVPKIFLTKKTNHRHKDTELQSGDRHCRKHGASIAYHFGTSRK